jgi:hypothetical protein
MTLSDYSFWYIRFLLTAIGPAVRREAANDFKLASDPALQADFENKKNGLMVLGLVSIIESNFLTKPDLKALRKFRMPSVALPASVNQSHLSCFIYLRDCFAHNPSGKLLRSGRNTSSFCSAVSSGTFPLAAIAGQDVTIAPRATHELHLNILRFYGQPV